ncbi:MULTISPECIES: gene transfer agent family protein [Nitratireductor]|uniref:gene transfer agent family protein n=1 Tax=Nitratireductor TaxID=245876 RepID=UPI0018EAB41D|nr:MULTISPECIES: gene transfer agent family protein [Nitratireductor]
MMIINPQRGEIAAELDGTRYRLCLTLGALAELEAGFGADDLQALVKRMASGRLSARDLARIVGAGLRGGGASLSDEEVMAMAVDGGVAGFAEIVARLLTATFGSAEATAPEPRD